MKDITVHICNFIQNKLLIRQNFGPPFRIFQLESTGHVQVYRSRKLYVSWSLQSRTLHVTWSIESMNHGGHEDYT